MRHSIVILALVCGSGCSDEANPVQDLWPHDQHPADQHGLKDGAPLDQSGGPELFDLKSQGVEQTSPALDGAPCLSLLGGATISGTVQGQVLQATHAGGWGPGSGIQGFMIFLSHQSTCAEAVAVSTPTFGIALCDAKSGIYTIGEKCETTRSLYIPTTVSIPLPGPDIKATAATITVEKLEPYCGGTIKGSFTADFSGELVSGTFDTISCAEL